MTAKKLLLQLRRDMYEMPEKEYETLCSITEEGNVGFICLSEKQVNLWITKCLSHDQKKDK